MTHDLNDTRGRWKLGISPVRLGAVETNNDAERRTSDASPDQAPESDGASGSRSAIRVPSTVHVLHRADPTRRSTSGTPTDPLIEVKQFETELAARPRPSSQLRHPYSLR